MRQCQVLWLCGSTCRYSTYASESLLLGESFAKPPCFVKQYGAVMKELCISPWKNKGVGLECDVCHINGNVVALPDKDRTDGEYEIAKYALGKHFFGGAALSERRAR